MLVSYDENGFYGHPDHIQAHRVAAAAVHLAAGPGPVPGAEGIEPWQVAKFYATAMPRSVAEPAGLPYWVPDDQVTTEIDGTAHLAAKTAALRAHATQCRRGRRPFRPERRPLAASARARVLHAAGLGGRPPWNPPGRRWRLAGKPAGPIARAGRPLRRRTRGCLGRRPVRGAGWTVTGAQASFARGVRIACSAWKRADGPAARPRRGGGLRALFVLGVLEGLIGCFQFSHSLGGVPVASLGFCALILVTCVRARRGWARQWAGCCPRSAGWRRRSC